MLPVFFLILGSAVNSFPRIWGSIALLLFAAIFCNFILIAAEDPPGRKWKPDARFIANIISDDSLKRPGICVIIPNKFEVPLYQFYLARSQCEMIRQPAFDDFFSHRRKDFYPTADEDLEENRWFARVLLRDERKISKVYIVSQRDKARVDEIAELVKARFERVERIEKDGILVIALECRGLAGKIAL
jgi:hypothetical protein